MLVDDLLHGREGHTLCLAIHPAQILGHTPHEDLLRLIIFKCPSSLRELILIDRAPQLLAFQMKKSINRPVITVQVVTATCHTSFSLHLLRNEHVVQLEEATLVRVLVRAA